MTRPNNRGTHIQSFGALNDQSWRALERQANEETSHGRKATFFLGAAERLKHDLTTNSSLNVTLWAHVASLYRSSALNEAEYYQGQNQNVYRHAMKCTASAYEAAGNAMQKAGLDPTNDYTNAIEYFEKWSVKTGINPLNCNQIYRVKQQLDVWKNSQTENNGAAGRMAPPPAYAAFFNNPVVRCYYNNPYDEKNVRMFIVGQ